jgi:uncharacterized OsmC-like protein
MQRPATEEPALSPSAAVCKLQKQRIRLYEKDPTLAWTTDRAWTRALGAHAADSMHTAVEMGTRHTARLPIGVHSQVGGWHDHPVPGDVLAAALASCIDSTLRVVAARMRVDIESLAVSVEADCDVRGTLCMAPEVPVGFQQMRLDVRLRLAAETDPERAELLCNVAEHCCVVLQTLKNGVPVDVRFRRD